MLCMVTVFVDFLINCDFLENQCDITYVNCCMYIFESKSPIFIVENISRILTLTPALLIHKRPQSQFKLIRCVLCEVLIQTRWTFIWTLHMYICRYICTNVHMYVHFRIYHLRAKNIANIACSGHLFF
jgi:hypothetical protein